MVVDLADDEIARSRAGCDEKLGGAQGRPIAVAYSHPCVDFLRGVQNQAGSLNRGWIDAAANFTRITSVGGVVDQSAAVGIGHVKGKT